MTPLFFLLGLLAASFAGVLSGRLATGESVVRGRSRCDACGFPLAPHALVPLLSYVWSGGRARCCGASLSASMPLAELGLGVLFALSYQQLGLSVPLAALLLTLTLLLALVLYDLAHQILPTPLLAAFVLLALLTAHLSRPGELGFALLIAASIGLFLALIHVASRGRAMGLADAPLAFGLALLVGPALAFSGLLFSFWIGAVLGIIILLRRPPGSRMGVEVPFAPYLAAGFLLAYFAQWNILTLIGLILP